MTLGLESELDRLFQVPLADFVVARNALAAALKKAGDAGAAARVKEIPKPSPSAWAVNQLYWRARPTFDALLAAGDEYRNAQQEVLRGRGADPFLIAEQNRRTAIDETLRRIASILSDEGPPAPSPSVVRRIETTLEALASYGSKNPKPMKGRLTEDVESPGFEALAGLAPALPPVTAEPDRDKWELEKLRTEAKSRVDEDERALAVANTVLDRARERVLELEKRVEEARSRWAEVSAPLESGEAARERN